MLELTNRRTYNRSDDDFLEKLEEIAKRFKGKGGDTESESSVMANKMDLKDGYVWFCSNNSDISNLISRSHTYIQEVWDYGATVHFKMSKKGFRNTISCFKVSK